MKNNFDWAVIGGGFKGIVVAYSLAKSGQKVVLIETAQQLGGFFTPIKWGEFLLDRGPQFFDNFEKKDRELFDEMIGPDILKDIGFSYKSHLAGITTDGFAIPDWRSKGGTLAQDAFAELLSSRINMSKVDNQTDDQNILSLDDLLLFEGSSVLYDELKAISQKFLQHSPADVSQLVSKMVTFCGRKVLLDRDVAIDLKKSPIIDGFLAAQKMEVAEERFNLYPKGSSLEEIRTKMVSALNRVGVDIRVACEINDLTSQIGQIRFTNGETVVADKIFMACDVRTSEKLLIGTDRLAERTHLLPEIFHCFAVPKSEIDECFYLVDYDVDHASTRMTNFGNFIGSPESQDLGVVCVEQAIEKGSPQWDTPDLDQNKVFREAQLVGNIRSEKYSKAKSFRIPVTYKVPLVGIEKEVDYFMDQVQSRFNDNIIVPDAYTLTRKEILTDLRVLGFIE